MKNLLRKNETIWASGNSVKLVKPLIAAHVVFFLYCILHFIFYCKDFHSNQLNITQNLSSKISEKLDESVIMSQQLIKRSHSWKTSDDIRVDLDNTFLKRDNFIATIEWIDEKGGITNRFGKLIGKSKKDKDHQIKNKELEVELKENEKITIASNSYKANQYRGTVNCVIDLKLLLLSLIDIDKNPHVNYGVRRKANTQILSNLSKIFLENNHLVGLCPPLKGYDLQLYYSTNKVCLAQDFIAKTLKSTIFFYVIILSFLVLFIKLKRNILAKEEDLQKLLVIYSENDLHQETIESLKDQIRLSKQRYVDLQKSYHLKHLLKDKLFSRLQQILLINFENYDVLPKEDKPRCKSPQNTNIKNVLESVICFSSELIRDVERVDIVEIIRQSKKILFSENVDFNLEIESKENGLLIETDKLFISVILLNILRVASRDLPDDGNIKITLALQDDKAVMLSFETDGFGYDIERKKSPNTENMDITFLSQEALNSLCCHLTIQYEMKNVAYRGKEFLLVIPLYAEEDNHRAESQALNVYQFKKQ